MPWSLAAILAAALVFIWRPWRPSAATSVPASNVIRFTIDPPSGVSYGAAGVAPFPAISPDGQQLAYQATSDNNNNLWIRPLAGLDAHPLGIDASQPFWSPDGRSLAFWVGGTKLQRLDLATGVVQTICDTPTITGGTGGGTWSTSGVIIYWAVRGRGSPLMQVPASGGTPTALTVVDEATQTNHRHATFLPDGRHFVYQVEPNNEIWIGSLDRGSPKKIMSSDSKVLFAPPDWVVFVRQSTLLAQHFDLNRLEPVGEPWPVAEDVRTNEVNGRSAFTVSSNGVLVYRAGDPAVGAVLTWFDRQGKLLREVPDSIARYDGLSLFPDERHAMAHIHDDAQGGGDLWQIDLDNGSRTRVRSDPGHDFSPVLSPDGMFVAWASARRTPIEILRKPSNGAGADQVWIQMDRDVLPLQWSRNWLVMQVMGKDGPDLWVAPVDGSGPPKPYLATEFLESAGRLSPDEHWMAYHSNETGQMDVYVRPFPDAQAGKWRVSGARGGGAPAWRGDGYELLYATAPVGGELMAVSVKPAGKSLEPGAPVALGNSPAVRRGAAFSRDGQRLLAAVTPPATNTDAPLTVIVNWPALLAKK